MDFADGAREFIRRAGFIAAIHAIYLWVKIGVKGGEKNKIALTRIDSDLGEDYFYLRRTLHRLSRFHPARLRDDTEESVFMRAPAPEVLS